ncbi:hypothetical protein M1D97_00670 [Kushneria sp. AK178]
MTNPYLALESVSCLLPDGRPLFCDLNEHFDTRHTGLIARNGIRKTMLARIMTGDMAPSSGICLRSWSVYYLARQVFVAADANADFLTLDEPTNHLEQTSRHALIKRLQQCTGGLIVVSHEGVPLSKQEQFGYHYFLERNCLLTEKNRA